MNIYLCLLNRNIVVDVRSLQQICRVTDNCGSARNLACMRSLTPRIPPKHDIEAHMSFGFESVGRCSPKPVSSNRSCMLLALQGNRSTQKFQLLLTPHVHRQGTVDAQKTFASPHQSNDATNSCQGVVVLTYRHTAQPKQSQTRLSSIPLQKPFAGMQAHSRCGRSQPICQVCPEVRH